MKKVLDHGFVELVDHMPQENLDKAIVDGARVSYQTGTKTTRGDRGLIRYLIRNWHTSPLELVVFKFRIKAPLYIARQWLRHRTASVNEMSARYSIVDEEYYEPEVLRGQSAVNHQGSEGVVELDDELNQSLSDQYKQAFKLYEQLLEKGVCREQARGVLPQSTYTSFVWKMDLHNLMHFLQLRMDHHAQKEIRDYATAIYELVQPLVPLSMEAFMDFRVNAMQLTGPEIEAISNGTAIESPGENREFQEKLKRLKLNVDTK
ncbi:FAD-dependent thymidylate synthase [bacterium]|nr:FAD-dependent thymidylate synthase [bacterium]